MFLNMHALVESLGNPFMEITEVPDNFKSCGVPLVVKECSKCYLDYVELQNSVLKDNICNTCMDEEVDEDTVS